MKKRHLLLTLLLTMLTMGNANAASHLNVQMPPIYSTSWGSVIQVTVTAHFEARVQSWQLDIELPEGLTIVDYSAGNDMSVCYFDRFPYESEYCQATIERQGNTFIGACPEQEGYWYPNWNPNLPNNDYECYGNAKWEADDYDDMLTLSIAVSRDFHGGWMEITSTMWSTEDVRGGTVIENGEHGQPYVDGKEIPLIYLEALPPMIETDETSSGDLLVTVTTQEDLSVRVEAYNADGLIYENTAIGRDQFEIYRTMSDQEITIRAYASNDYLMPSASEITYWLGGFDGVHDFEEDDIYYKYTSSPDEVKVAWGEYFPSSYYGQVVIPAAVNHEGQSYRVTAIGALAFNECDALTGVTIPSSVTTIETLAFVSCFNLTQVTLPASVTDIHREAFQACYNLRSVTSLATTPPTIHRLAFDCTWVEDDLKNDAIHRFATLYVPRMALEAYRADTEWSKFKHIEAIQDSGDVDGDGNVSIKDVTSLIDLLLSGDTLPDYADVNGDGVTSIKDVTILIDILLSNN